VVVGLLIVSHSAQIAAGVRELALQVSQGRVPIGAAGGAGDGSLGTSAELIEAAARGLIAQGAEQLLVLMDLGSAVMSAEMALEAIDRPARLLNAPLVEGAVVAAVEASIGADAEHIADAAEQAAMLRKVQRD
jgi:phosphoenolpyruvate---glycerone phosphotransferase subunit DhaM